jgi:hypothetical protein
MDSDRPGQDRCQLAGCKFFRQELDFPNQVFAVFGDTSALSPFFPEVMVQFVVSDPFIAEPIWLHNLPGKLMSAATSILCL